MIAGAAAVETPASSAPVQISDTSKQTEQPATAAAVMMATAEMGAAPCKDVHARCVDWANAGECPKNVDYMTKFCALSCGVCHKAEQQPALAQVTTDKVNEAVDRNQQCQEWARRGECQRNPGYMAKACAHSCKHWTHDES